MADQIMVPDSLPEEAPDKPVRFGRPEGVYGFLAASAPAEFDAHDHVWKSVAHYMECAQWESENLEELCAGFRSSILPTVLRGCGFYDQPWEGIRSRVMRRALTEKFKAHPHMAELLMATAPRELLATEVADQYWGCGPDGTGRNELGRLLTALRGQLLADRGSKGG